MNVLKLILDPDSISHSTIFIALASAFYHFAITDCVAINSHAISGSLCSITCQKVKLNLRQHTVYILYFSILSIFTYTLTLGTRFSKRVQDRAEEHDDEEEEDCYRIIIRAFAHVHV